MAAARITQNGTSRDEYTRSCKWIRMMFDAPNTFSANTSTQTAILNMTVPCLRQSPASTLGDMGSIPCQCMWGGGQTGSGARFLPEYLYRVQYDVTGPPRSFIYHRRYISPAIGIVQRNTNIHNTKMGIRKLN